MNQITTRREIVPASPPSPQSRVLSDRIAILSSHLERTAAGHWQVSDSLAASGADKAALQDRRAELAASLTPAQARPVAALLAQMFLRFPASANAPDQQGRIAAYTADLASQPAWAIQEAIAGATGQFAPSSSDLVAGAKAATLHIRNEIAAIDRVLNATVYHAETDEERARVANDFRELTEKIGWRDTGNSWLPSKSEAIQALSDARLRKPALPQLSDAALKAAGFVVKSNGEVEAA